MTIRATAAEAKNELFEKRLADKDQTITAQAKTIEIVETQLKKQTENREDAGRVFTIDQFRVEACQQQLQKADLEIARLRRPSFLRSIFDTRTLGGAMVGFGIGRVTK